MTVHRPNSAEDATSVNAILFNDDYLLLFSQYVTEREPDDENRYGNT